MGFLNPVPPPIDPATIRQIPYRERIRVLATHWVDYGFGSPKMVMFIYIFKMAFIFAFLGAVIITTTSHMSTFHPHEYWREPIFWEKMVVWIMFLETLGIAGSWGPLAGHFKPMTGSVLYWSKPGTLRNPPWPKRLPWTAGDERTGLDAAVYVGLLLALLAALVLPGHHDSRLDGRFGAEDGMISPINFIVIFALLGYIGLRDKTIFLAARSEQWIPFMVYMAFFPFVSLIVAAKLTIVMIWFGAGVSKLNRHFEQVIPVMASNTPWNPSKWFKRKHYRNFPEDLRPSMPARRLSHVGGAVGELIPPLILLFSQNHTVTVVTAVFMICYHTFIISTFPLAVPLEWNLAFMFTTAFLFIGYPASAGYALGDAHAYLLIPTFLFLAIWPILGELRPDLISFLPSLRQYSGNWASAIWAMGPGVEEKLDQHLVKSAKMQKAQLVEAYDEDLAEVLLHQLTAFRAMHSQGRGLNSLLMKHLGKDTDTYFIREAEFCCNAVIGWNFGDGHLHNEHLLGAMQKRCNFEPGEFIVAWVESEPIMNGRQQYFVYDLGVGVVERGSWDVGDAVAEQPWLPNGPIKHQVDWTLEGYTMRSQIVGELEDYERQETGAVKAALA